MRLVAAFGVLGLVAQSPPLREGLVVLEPVVAPTLFALALAAGAVRALAVARGNAALARRVRSLERSAGAFLEHWGFGVAVLLFLLPLWSHWAMRPLSRVSAFAALLGHIPYGDAHGHFEGGRRLLSEGEFGFFSERRPITGAWLAVRLALGAGHLPVALMIQAVLLGLAGYLGARSVGLRAGLWAGLASFALILGFSRDYLPTVLTEPLGLLLAILAATLLIARRSRQDLGIMALGVFALDAALRARPGAQFVLPLVGLWAILVFRRSWVRATAAVGLVVVLGTACTWALNAGYGTGDASATSYPAFTLYGLTRNSNYKQAHQDFPLEIERLGREDAVARFLYAKAFERLREDPTDFVRALAANSQDFAQKLPANLARLVSLRALFTASANRVRAPGNEVAWDLAVGGPLLAIALLGFAAWLWRTRVPGERGFWAAVIGGVLLSVPFVFGDAGFRGLAACYPFIAMALGVGLAGGAERRPVSMAARNAERRLTRVAAILAIGIVGISLVGPAVAHPFAPHPPAEDFRGLVPGRSLVVSLRTSPAVLVSNRAEADEGLPRVDRRRLFWLLEVADFKDPAGLEALPTPYLVASVYDFLARQQRLVVGPPRMMRDRDEYVRLDVSPLGESTRFVRVDAWSPLSAGPSRPTASEGRRAGPPEP